jgi:hypothetical protein
VKIREHIGNFVEFTKQAFMDKGVPSSSRIISAWLSVSSMALIWFIAKHAMGQPPEKLQVWIGGLPGIILALATFATSPYGVNRVTEMFKKDPPPESDKKEV